MNSLDRRTLLKGTGAAVLAGAAVIGDVTGSVSGAGAAILPSPGAGGCASEHARLSRALARKLALGPAQRSAHLVKTAHCAHCNTRIGADHHAVMART